VRNIGERLSLSNTTTKRLENESTSIASAANSFDEAEKRYAAARRAVWFRPIIRILADMTGIGQRCMYCSGSESAQVEHYRPKSIEPQLALVWENLVWSCSVCNQSKGNRFNENVQPINPIDDDIWTHFFIDQFGNLSPRWNIAENRLDIRAVETIKLHALDRQALQESRQERLIDLRAKVKDAKLLLEAGNITKEELEIRTLKWFEQPFQPDVADYFFAGPGSLDVNEPFKWLVGTLDL
jgi:uncharacterized protein (TIGR02646 family)